jgi:gliding motility-associated-like protein
MDAHLRPDAFFYRPPVRCPGELAHLSAQGELTPQATVVWTPAADAEQVMEAGNQLHLAFTQVGAHPITLTMTEYGCTASYTDSVTVYPFPTVDFTVDPGVCLGSPLRFVASAQASTPIQLSWDLGDDSMASGAEVLHTYAAPGSFTVRLTGTTHSGCIATVSEHKPGIAQVHPLPVAAFTALPEEVSLLDPRITVTDYASDAVAWSYAIDGQVVAVPGFEHVFDDGGIYRIQQTVTSAHGCTDETERIVVVSDHLFFAPTAFTPDGDGLNDVWLPSVRGARHYELVIYDRWGIERFRTDDPKQGWSGDGLPQSLYIYTAHIKEWGAFAKDYTGHFSLLR